MKRKKDGDKDIQAIINEAISSLPGPRPDPRKWRPITVDEYRMQRQKGEKILLWQKRNINPISGIDDDEKMVEDKYHQGNELTVTVGETLVDTTATTELVNEWK